MTPAARVAAAIEILDEIVSGHSAEKTLTRWGRRNRFAGSKDRAAIRDHVFDCLRLWRTCAHLGGGETGRALMIGLLRHAEVELADLFSGERHAPAPLKDDEKAFVAPPATQGETWNLPDWLLPEFSRSLGDKAETTALALQRRAPVSLRVNTLQLNRDDAIEALKRDDIEAVANPLANTALTVLAGERRVRTSSVFLSGGVELQDASSQAVTNLLPIVDTPLDYCAGGGGKALAMASRFRRAVFAHDIDPNRMSDIPARAGRAGVRVVCLPTEDVSTYAPYDLVLCDSPCSGSGAWRRSPEGKWTLTQKALDRTVNSQDEILDAARQLVKPGGILAYATCSVLRCENEDRIAAFLQRHPGWSLVLQHRFDVDAFGDGFYCAHLTID